MHTFQKRSGKKDLVMARLIMSGLVVSALAGCGASKNQAPSATSSVAAEPEAAPASAQHARSKRATSSPPASMSSSAQPSTGLILAQMHQANLREIALGKMAEQKASSDEVRAYADQLVRDHTSVDSQVVAMAQETGTDLKKGAEAHQAIRQESALEKLEERKLNAAKAPAFDKLFLQQASSDHEKLITKLNKVRQDASDEEIEGLIDKMIPILQQHRDLAQLLMKKEQA